MMAANKKILLSGTLQKNYLAGSRRRLERLRAEPSPQSQHPPKFSGHKSYESEDTDFSNCHVVCRW